MWFGFGYDVVDGWVGFYVCGVCGWFDVDEISKVVGCFGFRIIEEENKVNSYLYYVKLEFEIC